MAMRLRMRTQYPLPHGPGDRHLATVSPPPPHLGDRHALTREFASPKQMYARRGFL